LYVIQQGDPSVVTAVSTVSFFKKLAIILFPILEAFFLDSTEPSVAPFSPDTRLSLVGKRGLALYTTYGA
jgi:hypothetical protein